MNELEEIRARLRALYGENKKITGDYDKSLAVKCINGTFVGKRNDGVIAFKGIPFVGKQPVGELRWKAPVDVVPDDGVYEAFYNGKSPCQDETPGQVASMYVRGEDCLHLNVWKADDNSATKKPVMVWIHGGAYEVGGTVEPREEGCNFVRENPDVILVSIEYRLGVFGFFHLSHLPDGADYPDAQNLGLMDQIAALKWVHENISAFGGDPANVTIFGQSAGGGSVSFLPLIEGSHKYFQRVIAMSGSVALGRKPELAIACTNELMEKIGCKTVAEMQKLDAEKFFGLPGEFDMRVMPELDGKYLPLDPFKAYENGAVKDLDLMQGCTRDEFNYFLAGVGAEIYGAWLEMILARKMAIMTDEEKALAERYCNDIEGDKNEKYGRLFAQFFFNAPLIRQAELQTKAGGKSYVYYFTIESSVPLIKSGHAIELSTIFNHSEETLVTGRIFDETFSKIVRKMWVQFAKTGNPSLSAEISPDGKERIFPLYDTENKQVMVFDEFNIRAEKESAMKIVDWDTTYRLTKCQII